MQSFRISKGNMVICFIEGILSVLILLLSIKAMSIWNFTKINIFEINLLLISIFMMYLYISPLLFSSIILTEKGILLKTIDSSLLLRKEEIDNIIENEPNNFGLTPKYLKVKEKIRLYNRGLGGLLLFWYKTNKIDISQFDRNIVPAIKNLINYSSPNPRVEPT